MRGEQTPPMASSNHEPDGSSPPAPPESPAPPPVSTPPRAPVAPPPVTPRPNPSVISQPAAQEISKAVLKVISVAVVFVLMILVDMLDLNGVKATCFTEARSVIHTVMGLRAARDGTASAQVLPDIGTPTTRQFTTGNRAHHPINIFNLNLSLNPFTLLKRRLTNLQKFGIVERFVKPMVLRYLTISTHTVRHLRLK